MINELYCLYGKIFENAQYIEWNIALIASRSHNIDAANLFQEMQNMTMGQIINCAKKVEYFEHKDIAELEYILDKRNYLAHQFFKQNDIVKYHADRQFLQDRIAELNSILTRFQDFNNELSAFYRTYLRK